MSKQFLDDNQLVKLYVNGDENALTTLLIRHKRRVFSYVFMIVRNRELTEDIFQDTFFKVIHSLKSGQYYEDGKFLPWVLRISRNLVIDHFRKAGKMPSVPGLVNDEGEETEIFNILPAKDDENSRIEKKQFKKSIRNIIYRLPQEQKEVVIMRTYYDMSFKEISDVTKVSINTSLGRMRYALINLRKMMEEQKIEVPA